jgi:hypothetical protein
LQAGSLALQRVLEPVEVEPVEVEVVALPFQLSLAQTAEGEQAAHSGYPTTLVLLWALQQKAATGPERALQSL